MVSLNKMQFAAQAKPAQSTSQNQKTNDNNQNETNNKQQPSNSDSPNISLNGSEAQSNGNIAAMKAVVPNFSPQSQSQDGQQTPNNSFVKSLTEAISGLVGNKNSVQSGNNNSGTTADITIPNNPSEGKPTDPEGKPTDPEEKSVDSEEKPVDPEGKPSDTDSPEDEKESKDPYEINIDGNDYMFVQDQNNNGKTDSIGEILGSNDTSENLFQGMKDLDSNKDGTVSSQEFTDGGVTLAQIGEDGKVDNSQTYELGSVDLSSFEADSNFNGEGVAGTFDYNVGDESYQGQSVFEDQSKLESYLS